MFEKGATREFKKHAWGIIILGCIAMYFSCCLATDALNILQPAFTEKFGWSYSRITMPLTIGGYILIGLSFVYSTIIIKKGTRLFGTVGFAGLALGTALIGIAYGLGGDSSYIVFFVGALLTKFAVIAVQMHTFQLCAEWFHKTRGRILGIVTMAAPLNSATSVTLLTIGESTFGFSMTYIVVALILAIATVLAYLYGTTTPEELGMTPDGVQKTEIIDKSEKVSNKSLSMKEILTKSATWKIMLAFGILNGTIGAIMAFFITRMTEVNVPISVALTLLAVSSIIGIPISYVYGWIDDKFGTLVASRILGMMYIILMILLYFGNANNIGLIFVATIGMASMTGGTPNLHPSTIMYVFGPDEYQNANRYINVGISLISAYGIQLMSNILDTTGSLDMGYVIFGILALVATISLLLTKQVTKDQQYDKSQGATVTSN